MSAKTLETGETLRREVRQDRKGPARIEAADLFEGQNEVLIVHDEVEYRLRITSNRKLILTK